MGAYRDENKNGTWYCKFSYVNWKGQELNKKKRGFSTKKETFAWEKEFLNGQAGSVKLTFRELFELYKRDKNHALEKIHGEQKKLSLTQKLCHILGTC